MPKDYDFKSEIVFASSAPSVSRLINEAVKKGALRKIAPRVYSPKRNWMTISKRLMPIASRRKHSWDTFPEAYSQNLNKVWNLVKVGEPSNK